MTPKGMPCTNNFVVPRKAHVLTNSICVCMFCMQITRHPNAVFDIMTACTDGRAFHLSVVSLTQEQFLEVT